MLDHPNLGSRFAADACSNYLIFYFHRRGLDNRIENNTVIGRNWGTRDILPTF